MFLVPITFFKCLETETKLREFAAPFILKEYI